MAKGYEVLTMLCPNTEWVVNGNNYSDITWIKEIAVTQKEFEAGFDKYDSWKAAKDAQLTTDKAKLLERLGLTSDEANLLLQ